MDALDLGADGQDYYEYAHRFRHVYYLNKFHKKRNNENAFLERNTEHYLTVGHSLKSIYFSDQGILTPEEMVVIKKVYSEAKLKNKVFRRQANDELGLTLKEVQLLISGGVEAYLNGKNNLDDQTVKLTDHQLHALNHYTRADELDLLEDTNAFYAAITQGKLSPNLTSAYDGTTLLMSAILKNQVEAATLADDDVVMEEASFSSSSSSRSSYSTASYNVKSAFFSRKRKHQNEVASSSDDEESNDEQLVRRRKPPNRNSSRDEVWRNRGTLMKSLIGLLNAQCG